MFIILWRYSLNIFKWILQTLKAQWQCRKPFITELMILNFSICFTSLRFFPSDDSSALFFYFIFFPPAIFLSCSCCPVFSDHYTCNSPIVSSCPSDWKGLTFFQASWPVFGCFDFLLNHSSLWWIWNFSSSAAANSNRNHNLLALNYF